MKYQITTVILAKNEQANISRAINSVKFCSEILIIDDYSTDDTAAIAKKLGTKIIKHKLNDNYAQSRNFALKKAKNNWVLFIDADEQITKDLANPIKKAINTQKHVGFYINRQDNFMGKAMKHGEWGSTKLLRLARKNAGTWKRSVHEYWDIKGPTTEISGKLIHYPHAKLSDFINSIAIRSSIHATELATENKNTFLTFRLLTNSIGKFIKNIFLKKGILDGTHGFVFAGILSFQSFISWSQLWLNTHKNH